MPCFHPLHAFWGLSPDDNGKRPLFFSRSKMPRRIREAHHFEEIQLPCGTCEGCRLERSRQWAIRCVHESQMHDSNSFLTLTYAPENVPMVVNRPTLRKSDFQKFIKRLRIFLDRHDGPKIRLYYCGEYGDDGVHHPHYHALIFGFGFPDKTPWKNSPSGEVIYRSELLESLWTLGFSSVGDVNIKSAAYVARYVLKKQTGKAGAQFYEVIDGDGVVHSVQPEFTDMSRNGGIGKSWFEKFSSDLYPDDFVVIDNTKHRVPRYYDNLLDPVDLDEFKTGRFWRGLQHGVNNTPDRLRVRAKVQSAKLQRLKRDTFK